MELGDRLQRWWDRLRGYEPPEARPAGSQQGRSARAVAARPVSTLAGQAEGEALKLSVDGQPSQHPARRHGEAGFDPYANSAGYLKPRGWDGAPRK